MIPNTRWTERYIAIPFKDLGRDFSGADCFGIYLLILQHEAGIDLADVRATYRSPQAAIAAVEAEIVSGRWDKVATPDKFDCVHMTSHVERSGKIVKNELHVGCALGGGWMLHSELPGGPRLVRLDDPEVKNRVLAFYRPAALAQARTAA
jgi:hypothetical protein